jgi:hypothetical protein
VPELHHLPVHIIEGTHHPGIQILDDAPLPVLRQSPGSIHPMHHLLHFFQGTPKPVLPDFEGFHLLFHLVKALISALHPQLGRRRCLIPHGG